MAADVESDTLATIDAATSYTEDTDLFRGPLLESGQIGGTYPIPQKAVFVRFASGSPPVVHRSSNVEEKEWLVDILVRGNPGAYKDTRDDAQTILDAVNDSPPTGYIDAKTQTSHPQWIDQDDNGSHVFAVTLRLRKLEA
jgi:hypothetical protein